MTHPFDGSGQDGSSADGPRSSADGPRSSADGQRGFLLLSHLPMTGNSSPSHTKRAVCGWPEVVCVRMAGGRLLADGRRSSADGPGSSAGDVSPSRMVNVVKWVGVIGVSAGWG